MKKIIVLTVILLLLLGFTVQPISKVYAAERKKLVFDLIVPSELSTWVRAAEIYKNDLAKIGIQVNIKAMETGAWVTAMMNTHDFDIAMCGMLMEPTPSYLSELFHSKYAKSGFNIAGVKDPKLDELLDKSMVTTDPTLLKQIIYKIQGIIAENVYSIPIITEDVIFAYNNKFRGVIGMAGGVTNIWTYLNMMESGREGGEIRIGMMGDIKTSNPLMRTLALESYIDRMLYDGLVEFAPNLTIIPWLASSWDVSSDGKIWTFHLIHNATWNDNTPLTAKDVVFTISTVLKNKPPTWYSYFELIDHAEAVDDYTVKIYMKKPYAWLLTTFATFPILPEHVWKNISWNATNPPMIGSGPFKWVEWRRGEYVKLIKNPNYWRGGVPHIDTVIWKVYRESSTAVLALRSGEIDLLYRYIPREAVKTLMEDPNVNVGITPGLNFRYFIPNMRRAPFNDINIRKALAYAVDKDTIAKKLWLGYAEPIDSFVSQSWGIWNNPNVPKYEFNLKKAAKILDEAGYIDVDGDGIREMPGVSSPTPTPTPTATPTTKPSTPAPSPTPPTPYLSIGAIAVMIIIGIIIGGVIGYSISRKYHFYSDRESEKPHLFYN